jgi:hypothetical protein
VEVYYLREVDLQGKGVVAVVVVVVVVVVSRKHRWL